MPHIIAYARASHAEYRVGIEKLVPFREHMGDERVEPIFLDFEMDVGGPHRAAVRGREHFSNSAVGRDWIAFGEDRFRSEEHTSELQSLMRISYAVFCLKKKTH